MRIPSFLSLTLFPLFVFPLFPVFAFSQEPSNTVTPNETKLKPIQVEDHTLGGLRYSVDGRFLVRYKDFEELISPLRDYEADRLLKRSETSEANSRIFGIVGLVGVITGVVGIFATPADQRVPFWLTGAGGAVIFDVGTLFQSEAQSAKFNCVQRYNRFARGEEQVLPQGPSDEKSLLDFNSQGGPKTTKETAH